MAGLCPVLVSNGEERIPCDGVMRFKYRMRFGGQQIRAVYMFGNLITSAGHGADVILWSPSYGASYPGGPGQPSSKWAPIGDLHIFSRPDGHTGGRQGESWRNYSPDGIQINDYTEAAVIGWGGGTLELYIAVYVA